jgi:hypothetical protein
MALSGMLLGDRPVKINYAKNAIVKPQVQTETQREPRLLCH